MASHDTESNALLKQRQRTLTLTKQSEATVQEGRLSLPTTVSAVPIKVLPVIRLAYFYECSCHEFGSNESHLSVTTKKSELDESRGVAISYTWGEFDRQLRVVGHWSGSPKEAVAIVLGAEWGVPSFKRRLTQLTTRYGACWIDQLCIPQTEEKIRNTLAEVPSNYKILPVVVLLPGSLCKCLRQAVDDYRDATLALNRKKSPDTKSDLDSKYNILRNCLGGVPCLNSSGSCSWPHRLWTFQEFLSSATVSVLHINEGTAPCFLLSDPKTQVDQLSDYLRVCYGKAINERELDHHGAIRTLKELNVEFFTALMSQCALVESDHMFLAGCLLLREAILRGKLFRNPEGPFPFTIIHVLADVKQRRATKDLDYILSTCTIWQNYSIPRNYTKLTAPDLLEDLLHQLHLIAKVFVPSTSPSGLLGGESNTAAWDSSSSRKGGAIRDSTDVFGVLSWDNRLLAVNTARIAVKLLPGSLGSLGMAAQPYGEWEQENTIFMAIQRLYAIVSEWKPIIKGRVTNLTNRHQDSEIRTRLQSSSPTVQLEGLTWLVSNLIGSYDDLEERSGLDTFHDMLLNLPIQMLEYAVYELASEAIRADSGRLREKKVKLVFSKWHGQRWGGDDGWTDSSGTCMGFVNWPLINEARSAGHSLLTVAIRAEPAQPFYEVVKCPALPKSVSEYAVIGIWLPLDNETVKINEIGGILVNDDDEHSAVLV